MKASLRHVAAVVVLALAAGHCGGQTTANGSGAAADTGSQQGDGPSGAATLDDSGLCEGTAVQDGAVAVPPEHRAAASACSLSSRFPLSADGGAIACASAADCSGDAASVLEPIACLGGQCTYDQCLTDSDCPTGSLCLCAADAGGGNIIHANACVPAACRLDSDCPSGYCSPDRTYCDEVSGYYCHSPHDTCVDPTIDCPCITQGGAGCLYAPQVGYWVCGQSICLG